MKKIVIKNVSADELLTLQQEMYDYHNALEKTFKKASNLLDTIITLDIAFRLWFLFRTKIERQTPKNGFQISLTASEAAVLLKVCLWTHKIGDYERNVKLKYSNYLDQQIKSL